MSQTHAPIRRRKALEPGKFPTDTSDPSFPLPLLRPESGRRLPVALRKLGDPHEALQRRSSYGHCDSFG